MDPIQFLRLAEWLANNQQHAAGWRSAISRAYYAAHHFLKTFVESAGVTVLTSSATHSDVWKHLTDVDDAEIEQVANELAELHSKRIEADYQLSLPSAQNPKTTALVIAQVKSLIEIVNRARNDKPRFEKLTSMILGRNSFLRGISRD